MSLVSRYHLPHTPYFDELAPTLSLKDLAGYAHAETRRADVGYPFVRRLKAPLSGPHDYSPYGAAIVERARELGNGDAANSKWERAVVFSPGTAVLGLGSVSRRPNGVLMASASGPIMMGKSAFFLIGAGVDADHIPLEIPLTPSQKKALNNLQSSQVAALRRRFEAENLALVIASAANNYGFINIEDARGGDLPLIFGALAEYDLESTIWSDDMQGTGVITAAALLSWAEVTGRVTADNELPLKGLKAVIFGAGAGAYGVYKEMINHGMQPEDILVTDTGIEKDSSGKPYPIYEGRADLESDPYKIEMSYGIDNNIRIEEFAKGADIIINLGDKKTLTQDRSWTETLVRNLADKPFFGPMTNPDPGITPEELRAVRPDAVYGSGNQVYENPVNNFVAFSFGGAGALMAKATAFNVPMTVAAARGIRDVARLGPPDWLANQLPEEQLAFGAHWLVPVPLDKRLIRAEAGAVASAAMRSGVSLAAGEKPDDSTLAKLMVELDEQLRVREAIVQNIRDTAQAEGDTLNQIKYPTRFAPFTWGKGNKRVWDLSPQINPDDFILLGKEMGVRETTLQGHLDDHQQLSPKTMTRLMNTLKKIYQENPDIQDLLGEEIDLIIQITSICPAMGAALALRRIIAQGHPENLEERPTVFDKGGVEKTVAAHIPEAKSRMTLLRTKAAQRIARRAATMIK